MSKYSDTSRDAFERALRGMAQDVPAYVLQRLERLLEDEQLHDADLIRQAVERGEEAEAVPDAD